MGRPASVRGPQPRLARSRRSTADADAPGASRLALRSARRRARRRRIALPRAAGSRLGRAQLPRPQMPAGMRDRGVRGAFAPSRLTGNRPSLNLRAPWRSGLRLILFPVCALLLAAAQPGKPTTLIEPRAQALIADLPAAPVPPVPEGPALPLAEAIARARAASPDLAILRERVVQARLEVRRAWAQ